MCMLYTHSTNILQIDLTSGILSIKGIFLVCKQNCDTPPSNITPWVIHQEYSLCPSSPRILFPEFRSSLSSPIFCLTAWSWGAIFAFGASGPGFNSHSDPS